MKLHGYIKHDWKGEESTKWEGKGEEDGIGIHFLHGRITNEDR